MNTKILTLTLMTAATAAIGAPVTQCSQPLRVSVQNLSTQPETGYLSQDQGSTFTLAPKQTKDILIQPATGPESRVEVFMARGADDATRRCVGYVALPQDCSSDSPAGRVYLYETTHGQQCFVRTIAKLPRTHESTVAMK